MANNRPNDRKREMNKARKAAEATGMNRKARRAERFAALKAKPVETPVTDGLKAKGRKRVKSEKVADTTATLEPSENPTVTTSAN